MERRVLVAALLLAPVVWGCGSSAADEHPRVVLKVSAPHGLSAFQPGAQLSGSTAHAIELVFDQLSDHTEIAQRKGSLVVLRRKSGSTHSVEALASSLRFSGLFTAAVRGQLIHVQFEDERKAASFDSDSGMFDVGPYRLERQIPGKVFLRRRTGEQRLEIIEVPMGEQWRRLLAHDIDVIPSAAEIHRTQFAGMASVRTIDLPVATAMILAFNVSAPPLQSVQVRSGLASVIEREPIANLVCGNSDCVARYWDVRPPQRDIALPEALELLILERDESFMQVARALRHQLRKAGIRLRVTPVSLEEIGKRHGRGEYQLALLPVPASPSGALHRLGMFYRDPTLAAALAKGDLAAARRRVRDQVPAVSLYEVRQFAAVDRSFCGGRPKSSLYWRWLAELHPCATGRK